MNVHENNIVENDAPPERERRPPAFIGAFGALSLIAIAFLMARSPAARVRIGELVPAFAILNVAHLTLFYFLACCVKLTVEEYSLFYGGALARWRLGETWFRVGWFPLGGYVKFKGMNVMNAPVCADGWQHQPRLVRAAIPLSGPFAVLMLSFFVLGKNAFVENIVRTPAQVRELFSAPRETMKSVLHFVDSSSFPVILGAFGVKMAMLNLLPLPILNGGQTIIELFNLSKYRRVIELLQFASLAAILTCFIFIVYYATAVAMRN